MFNRCKRALWNRYASIVLRISLRVMFVASGLVKLPDRVTFTQAVRSYQILPEQLAGLFSIVLPPLELLIGAYLHPGIDGAHCRSGAVLLTASFATATAVNLVRGTQIECGCFGIVGATLSSGHLVIDLLLLLAGLRVLLGKDDGLGLDIWIARVMDRSKPKDAGAHQ